MMIRQCRMVPLLIAAVLLVLQPVAGQGKGFLNIRGIKGESTDKNHDGWIDVVSVNLGANNRLLRGGATTRSSSRTPGTCTIVKTVDRASTPLQQKAASGQGLGTVELQFVTTDSGGNPVYLKFTMSNVVVTSFSTQGSGGNDQLTESVTFSYGSAKWEYAPPTKIN